MSIKRKLILIGICIIIVVAVIATNVIRRLNEDKQENQGDTIVTENVITRAEAFRLLSYLEFNKKEREALSLGITYADGNMSGWYDSYVNAVWKMGLIEGNVDIAPSEALTYGSCKELLDKLIMKKPEFQTVYTGLSFDFISADRAMSTHEFLEVYEALLSIIPEDEKQVKKDTLFVLGTDMTDDGMDRMVTDQGKYYYQTARSYETQYEQMQKEKQQTVTTSPRNPEVADDQITMSQSMDKTEENPSYNQQSSQASASEDSMEGFNQADFVDQYLDKGIQVLLCDQEILYITAVTTEKMVIHNVWISKGVEQQVETFVNGLYKTFDTKYIAPENKIEKVIGDITIENQRIVQISVKPDKIEGKVLQTAKDFIEIEGYGKLPLEEDFRIYKLYGDLSIEPTSSILVGYENTDFIVSGGKISAALITESIKAENIRVLIRTSKFKDVVHDQVVLTASSDFIISNKKDKKKYSAGDKVTIEEDNEMLKEGRITVEPVDDGGRIELLSIERSQGTPKYRGRIEIAENGKGLLVVNELPLEEYLYSVIPSEMPTYYGMEALKVQAVCARSYAYKHLLANSLSEYGAHVDDSVSYQVYNNISENEDAVLAVKDTYGKVIEYDGEVIIAYYFSTSCGHTSEASSVWANNVEMPYLNGKLMVLEEKGEGAEAEQELEKKYQDLSTEESFKSFITSKIPTIDSDFNWYRWKVAMSVKDIKKVINNSLAARYNANPNLILTMTEEAKDGNEAVFESLPVDTVGDVVDISVLKRDRSGIITELLITGSEKTIKVLTEYNIRVLLAPTYDTVIRQDESKVDKLSLLPSAFFRISKKEKEGKLSSIVLTGGGYGHGVGMSQNGVKALADAGKEYDEIVAYFYEGTKIGFIYE